MLWGRPRQWSRQGKVRIKLSKSIKWLLDRIIRSKTNLKAESMGLMPRLRLRPLSCEEIHTFGQICAVYRLQRHRLRRSQAQRTATRPMNLHSCFISFFCSRTKDIVSHCLIEMIFFVCYLPHVRCLFCTCTSMCHCTTLRRLTPPL